MMDRGESLEEQASVSQDDIHKNRKNFPCGLVQARHRSSVDALLLAAFAMHGVGQAGTGLHMVELGAGSGMASCALALALPSLRGLGVEKEADAVTAALGNARRLGLAQRLAFVCAALEDVVGLRQSCGSDADLVLANPPYYQTHCGRRVSGRLPLCEGRGKALHAHKDTLSHFFAAAFALLRHHGHFFCIHGAGSLTQVLACLQQQRLGLRRVLPVYTRPGRDARWILLEARRDAAEDIHFEAGLTLYAQSHGPQYSVQAVEFCPWLLSNA